MEKINRICPKCNKNVCGNLGSFKTHVNNCDGKGTDLDKQKSINHICPRCGYYITSCIEKHISVCDGRGPRRLRRKMFPGKIGGWNRGLTKETSFILKQKGEDLHQKYINGELTPSWSGKSHSEETKQKISKSQKNYYEKHPDKIPYLLNHSSKESYPEKYFREVFEKEQVPLKQYKQISLYELDFYNENLKIDIEIDGDTHKQKKVQEIDRRKDAYLSSLGWKVIRIVWSEWQKKTHDEKHTCIEQLKQLFTSH